MTEQRRWPSSDGPAGRRPQEAPAEDEPSTEHRDALAAGGLAGPAGRDGGPAGAAQRRGTATAIRNRAASLERAAATERRAREEAARTGPPAPAPGAAGRRRRRRRASSAGRLVDVSVELARRERDARRGASASRGSANWPPSAIGNDALARELAELTDSVHRDELARAQQRLRIEALETRSIEELGLTAGPARGRLRPGPARAGRPAASTDKWAALRAPVDEDGSASRRGQALRPRGAGEAAQARPNATWPPWARSTRWRWRSSPRWRNATSSSAPSWRTSSPAARTCWTSSRKSTSGCSRSSPRPSRTPPCSSSASSPGCSPAARAGWS